MQKSESQLFRRREERKRNFLKRKRVRYRPTDTTKGPKCQEGFERPRKSVEDIVKRTGQWR